MKLTHPVKFSILERNSQMIDEILASGEYTSRSEVVRQAIAYLHKRVFPYYKVVGKSKEEEEARIDELKKLPDEEYAKEVLEADIKTKPGFAILVHRNNKAWEFSIPLKMVKNFPSRDEAWKSVGQAPEHE